MLINTDGKRKHWGNANITFKCILHESHVQLRKSKKRGNPGQLMPYLLVELASPLGSTRSELLN